MEESSKRMSRVENENNNESIQKWFNEEVGDGKNGIVVYTPICNRFARFTHSLLKSN